MKKNSVSILLILFVLLFGMALRLAFLQKQVIPLKISETVSLPEIKFLSEKQREMPEDESLFHALRKAGLILPLDDDRLEMKPPDHFLIQKTENPDLADTEEMKEREKLLRDLYHSPPGHMIRNQVRLWNETRFIAAVRDNRPGAAEHPDSQWQVYEKENPEWQFPRTGNLVPENFGYVNQGILTPGYTDWRTAFSLSESVEFRSSVEVQKDTLLTVQVIGKPVPPLPSRAGKPEPCCSPDIETCTADQADAFQISIPLKAGKNRLSITVSHQKQ
ncbi:MAG: hypothetical protein R2941_13610 [Desulfobacterales bacterium]